MGAFTWAFDDQRCPSTSEVQRRGGGWSECPSCFCHVRKFFPFKAVDTPRCPIREAWTLSLCLSSGVSDIEVGCGQVTTGISSGWENARPETRVSKSWVGWGYTVNLHTEIKGCGLGTSVFCQNKWKSWMCAFSVVSDSLWLHGLQPIRILCPWDSSGKNTGARRIPFSRGSSGTKDWTHVSCTVGIFFTHWAIGEAPSWRGWRKRKKCCSSTAEVQVAKVGRSFQMVVSSVKRCWKAG